MKLIRQHLQLEGHIEKECLVELVLQTTAVFSKYFDQKKPCPFNVECPGLVS